MKKLIVILLLIFSNAMAEEEVKLYWKGCSIEMLNVMLTTNLLPKIRYTDNVSNIFLQAVTSTKEEPFIMSKELYKDSVEIFDAVYIAMTAGAIFDYIGANGYNDKSIKDQNTIIDGINYSIIFIDCMEVLK